MNLLVKKALGGTQLFNQKPAFNKFEVGSRESKIIKLPWWAVEHWETLQALSREPGVPRGGADPHPTWSNRHAFCVTELRAIWENGDSIPGLGISSFPPFLLRSSALKYM